ncbi:MAG TPA: toxic anion resistance protein, partial [Candidatus Mediterraneibacter norwichensis]|nr:toxic anion resistance protein [Candidatus Mediterraneibacter norwichensis]
MSEITLSDLIKTSSAAAEVPSETTPEEISAQISVLTPEERRQADEIREQIDVRDSQMVMQFGAGARQNIADFSENILKNIRAKDSGYVGALMTDLVTNVEKLDFDSLEKGNGILGLFQKLEAKVKRFLAQYEKLELQVDRIEGKLEEARMEMLKDIGILDSLYEKNLNYFRQLQVYITAGQEKLDELREKTIPSLRAEAEKSGDPMHAQLVRDFEDLVNQFEKKLYDLKTSKTIAIQTAPQIRLIQNNDKLLADKIQTAIQETIPLWKSQMVMALGLYRQQEALRLQRNVTETTNAMLLKNSEKLKQNTLDVAKESERGIVDIETLKKANQNLISTINEAVRIQKEGHEK